MEPAGPLLEPIPGAGAVLEFERALVMFLLVVSLLRSEPWRRQAGWVVLGGLALSLWAPEHRFSLPWSLLSALLLPPLLWQVAVQLMRVRNPGSPWSWLLWLLITAVIGGALVRAGGLEVQVALPLGMIFSGLLCRTISHGHSTRGTDVVAQLALALLLAEVDIIAQGARPFLGSIFASFGVGLALGIGGVRAGLHLESPRGRNWLCLALMYASYPVILSGFISPVVVLLTLGITLVEYGFRAGLWATRDHQLAPLSSKTSFMTMSLAFLFLGWQSHAPLAAVGTPLLNLLLVALFLSASLLHHRQKDIARKGGALRHRVLPQDARPLLLLVAILLLWPRATHVDGSLLALALVGSLTAIVGALIFLYGTFELFGIRERKSRGARERIHVYDGEEGHETINIFLN